VTGYGRTGDSADRVAFGDDAAVAAGLVAYDADGPVFCGDAIADPLAGLYAGLAAAASIAAGGGHLIEVSMAGVCAHVNRSGDGRQVRDHRLVASGGSYHCEHVAEAPC
jgi:crotonobetainyl-CoA:carnitine CoA-transferase CaiB-like acyl-CoA transferase